MITIWAFSYLDQNKVDLVHNVQWPLAGTGMPEKSIMMKILLCWVWLFHWLMPTEENGGSTKKQSHIIVFPSHGLSHRASCPLPCAWCSPSILQNLLCYEALTQKKLRNPQGICVSMAPESCPSVKNFGNLLWIQKNECSRKKRYSSIQIALH